MKTSVEPIISVIEPSLEREATGVELTQSAFTNPSSSTFDAVKGLNREQERALIESIHKIYGAALSELSQAPGVLKTLPHLVDCVEDRGISLSLIMHRGGLSPFELREKFEQLIIEADLEQQASEKNETQHMTQHSGDIFKKFGFTTAVVDLLGGHYCDLFKQGSLPSYANTSYLKLNSLMQELQPLRDLLFSHEERFLVSSVKSRIPTLKGSSKDPLMIDDLYQEARKSLFVALHKFDPRSGNLFHTFADDWIGKAVFDGIAENRQTIRIPKGINERLVSENKMNRDGAIIDLTTNSMPADETLERAKRALRPISFSSARAVDDTDGLENFGDFIADPSELEYQSDLDFYDSKRKEILEKLKTTLTDREYGVLAARSGVEDGEVKEFSEIADSLGIPSGTARQIYRRALQKALATVAGSLDTLGLDVD